MGDKTDKNNKILIKKLENYLQTDNKPDDLYDVLLPDISKDVYIKEYNKFKTWLEENDYKLSEDNVLRYLVLLSKNYCPTTLISTFSMIKACFLVKEKINLSEYKFVTGFLNKNSENYIPKTAKVLEEEDMEKFIRTAPDEEYLLHKVILIMGIQGCIRRKEIYNIKITDLEDDVFIVKIPVTKTKKPKQFLVTDSFYTILKKYINLRPLDIKTDHLFLGYRAGKCIKTPAGINKIAGISKDIATFLKLKNPELYTSHALRRSSASLAANAGCSVEDIQNLGNWGNAKIANHYVVQSMKYKKKIATTLSNKIINSNTEEKEKEGDQETKSAALVSLVPVATVENNKNDVDEKNSNILSDLYCETNFVEKNIVIPISNKQTTHVPINYNFNNCQVTINNTNNNYTNNNNNSM